MNLAAGTLAVTRTWNDHIGLQEGTKTGKSRLVPLAPPARAVLEKLRPANAHPDDRVFPLKVRNMHHCLQQAGKKAEISRSVHPHLLRHTCASWLLQNGVDLVVVAQVLGHSTLEMTSRYAHAALNTTQSAVQRLPRLDAMLDKVRQRGWFAHSLSASDLDDSIPTMFFWKTGKPFRIHLRLCRRKTPAPSRCP